VDDLHPSLEEFAALDAAVRDGAPAMHEAIAQAQPLMRLIEGHASLITGRLLEMYPKAQFEEPPWLPALILGWLCGTKLRQYEAAAVLADLDPPHGIHALYHDPEQCAAVLGA
jgi:hypothetical protein